MTLPWHVLTNCQKSFQDSNVMETGLSDFHKLTFSVLKTTYKKEPPKLISYRKHNENSMLNFKTELGTIIYHNDLYSLSNDDFVAHVTDLYNKHIPERFKYVRGNDSPFMTKELRKSIMKRSKLRNSLNREKTLQASLGYKDQRI